jgi:hypothetical protein
MIEGKVKVAISTVLKPAVLGVALVKKAVTIFPKNVGCDANAWLYSRMKNITKPKNNNINVV